MIIVLVLINKRLRPKKVGMNLILINLNWQKLTYFLPFGFAGLLFGLSEESLPLTIIMLAKGLLSCFARVMVTKWPGTIFSGLAS